MKLIEFITPKAPCHWDNSEAAAWQSGYESGVEAVLAEIKRKENLPKPYVIKDIGGQKTIHVCAWCYPGKTILVHFPELNDGGQKTINHGICNQCREKMKAV